MHTLIPSAATMRSAVAVSPFSKRIVPATGSMSMALWFTLRTQADPLPASSNADLRSCLWMSMRWKLL